MGDDLKYCPFMKGKCLEKGCACWIYYHSDAGDCCFVVIADKLVEGL